MSKLRAELEKVLNELLNASRTTNVVTLDAVGDAIGARAISTDEIELLISRLEDAGRSVLAPQGGDGESWLHKVVDAARALTEELGRKPTANEVAQRAKLTTAQVRQALQLLTIMQR